MSAQLAVLGLLVERPAHGYAIEQLIEQRGMRKWASIGASSVYYVLNQLAADGLATAEEIDAPGRGPRRRVLTVTPEGRDYWQERALKAIADAGSAASDFLLAISGFPLLDPAEAQNAFDSRVAELDSRIEQLDDDRRAAQPVPPQVEAMFDLTLSQLETDRAWTQSFLSKQLTQPTPRERGET